MDAEQIRNIDVINGTINTLPSIRDAGDDALAVQFQFASHFNDAKTREEGRPIFEMREYIMITIPGDLTGNVFRPVRPEDITRFPRQYQSFKVGQEQAQGMPLKEWTQISRAQVDELAFFRITTVEQLASVSDTNAQKFMGLNELRRKAQIYLDAIKSEAPFAKMNAEIIKRDEEIALLRNKFDEAMDMMRAMKAAMDARDASQEATSILSEAVGESDERETVAEPLVDAPLQPLKRGRHKAAEAEG